MKKLFLFFLFSTLFFTSSCEDNDDNQIFCTDQFVYGLNVIVLDAVTGNPIFQDIEVKAVDGTYLEILELVPSSEYAFVGAGERAGTYVVTITKAGYQTYTSAPIVLTRDECHVIPQSLTVNLQSN
jgi:hypothetical protein